MVGPFKKNRKLGVAEGKGRYDLPLNQGAGTHFLVMLVALMAFLALMAITATMLLNNITHHWASGLENKLTIEIPALKPDEKIRTSKQIADLSNSVAKALKKNPNIRNFEILDEQKIQELVSPWLGDDVVLDDIPLPGLISVHLKIRDKEKLEQLTQNLTKIASDIRLDTHEDWLEDILRLAGTLKFSSFIVTLIIGLTTIIAIAGAIRSRMAEHKADIELLHLMGASDLYITKQLQRHAVVLTLKGSVIGVFFGLILLCLLWLAGGQNTGGVLPNLSLGFLQILPLFLLPAVISLIAAKTTRLTVLRVLANMP